MKALLFDGRTWQPCTPELAAQAMSDTSLSWIDMRLDSLDDPAAPAMLQALGVDPAKALDSLKSGLQTAFVITASAVEGVAWLAGDQGTQPTQARFSFDGRRMLTLRTDGDAAFAQVQDQLQARADLAIKQPTRIVGFVLQAMLTTVQRMLTDLSVNVGVLDMDIITTDNPSSGQSQQLVGYRQSFQPFATRFPGYVMSVNAALLDPDTITALDQPGIAELQNFASQTASTEALVTNLADAIRNAVQDLQGQVANWQGNRINQLTVVTIVFLPITFLTGYFGMNFNWVDNLLATAPAYWILGVTLPILTVLASILWLTRRGFSVGLRTRRHRGRPGASSSGSS